MWGHPTGCENTSQRRRRTLTPTASRCRSGRRNRRACVVMSPTIRLLSRSHPPDFGLRHELMPSTTRRPRAAIARTSWRKWHHRMRQTEVITGGRRARPRPPPPSRAQLAVIARSRHAPNDARRTTADSPSQTAHIGIDAHAEGAGEPPPAWLLIAAVTGVNDEWLQRAWRSSCRGCGRRGSAHRGGDIGAATDRASGSGGYLDDATGDNTEEAPTAGAGGEIVDQEPDGRLDTEGPNSA